MLAHPAFGLQLTFLAVIARKARLIYGSLPSDRDGCGDFPM